MAEIHEVNLPRQILTRGFWLYVWKMAGPKSENFCYVGMTGDTTGVAQSPFNRASAHFGFNKNSNQIRKKLMLRDIEPESCKSIKFLVFGPVYPYFHSDPCHVDFHPCRLKVASLENELWKLCRRNGFVMLNKEPQKGSGLDEAVWKDVERAF